MVKGNETLTVLSYDAANNVLTYKDEAGVTNTINIGTLVKNNETLTTLAYDNATKILTYRDEKGTSNTIDISQVVKGNETLTVLSYDNVTNTLTYKDEKGISNTINLKDLVQNNQKTSSVTNGTYTTVATTTPTANNTNYQVDVNPLTLAGAGLKVNAGKLEVDIATIPNASDKTATVASGNNTTVATDATNPNNPIYKVNVATANGTTLGVVREAASNPTVKINNGELSINLGGTGTPADPGAGRNLSSTDLDITNGNGATLTSVTANIKNGAVTAAKLNAGAGTAGRVGIADAAGVVTYGTTLPAGSVTGNNLSSTDLDITNGNGATLTTVTANIKNGAVTAAKMANAGNNQVLTTDGLGAPTWINQSTLVPATTHTLGSSANTITSVVNGVSVTAPAVNSVANSLTGTNLTTTVNGVSSTTAIDLKPAVTAATTHTLGSSANTITSVVNGISVTAPAVNSVANSLTGTNLTTTVNGVSSTTAIDLKPAVTAATTHTLGSSANTITSVVNGISVTAPAVNSVANSLAGTNLTTTVNGVGSTQLDLTPAVQNALKFTNGTNTTLVGNGTTTPYEYDVATANGTTLGVVKQAAATPTINIAGDGTLSVNVNNIGKSLITDGIILANNTNSVNGAVLSNINLSIQNGSIGTAKLANSTSANQVLASDGNNVPTWVNPSSLAVNNLYTSNGSLVANRIVDLNAKTLTFNDAQSAAAAGRTQLSYTGGARITHATTTGRADVIVQAGGSTLNIFQDVDAQSQIKTGGTSSSLSVGTGNNTPFTLATNNTERMYVAAGGNIGIGVTGASVSNALHVKAGTDPLRLEGLQGQIGNEGNQLLVANNIGVVKKVAPAGNNQVLTTDAIGVPTWVSQTTTAAVSEPWKIQGGTTGATSNTQDIYQNGKVAIGDLSTPALVSALSAADVSAKLFVNGTITTANSLYADYVFEDYFDGASKLNNDYTFKSLKEIEEFINKNKHLPGVTGIKGLTKNEKGEYVFNISTLSVQLLEKVEELYLHIIEQQKQLDAKDKEIDTLKAQQQKMEARLKRLEEAMLAKEKENK